MFTVRVTGTLVTDPCAFETVTVYWPASSGCTVDRTSEAEVAPAITAPPFDHWYAIGAVPVATTVNVADRFRSVVRLAGCVVMVGGTGGGIVTVRTAGVLVTKLTGLVTV